LKKVIVVDDSREVGIIISLALRGIAEVKVFKKPLEALGCVKKEDTIYDYAFIDLCMPELDGLELSKRLRKLNKIKSIILITAYYSLSNPNELLERKEVTELADYYIRKPFCTEAIQSVVEQNNFDYLYKIGSKKSACEKYDGLKPSPYHRERAHLKLMTEGKILEELRQV